MTINISSLRAPNPQKQLVLDRIASVDLTLSKLKDKSFAATVFAAFGDCFEVFAKSKAGLPEKKKTPPPQPVHSGHEKHSESRWDIMSRVRNISLFKAKRIERNV